MTHCLDSWAVIRWLEDQEPGAARVAELLEERPVMSWINVGEVAYVMQRKRDRATALEFVRDLRGRLQLDVATPDRVLAASDVKARHSISYADAFAVVTAIAHDAVLVTGDPELIEAGGDWRVEDLR